MSLDSFAQTLRFQALGPPLSDLQQSEDYDSWSQR